MTENCAPHEAEMKNKELAMRISVVSIIANLVLSIGKLAAGVIGHSAAMVSDAIHSASDLFSTLMVIIGINISSKEADEKHPYGHERLESVVAVLLGMVLMLTGGIIGYDAVIRIINYKTIPIEVPSMLPLIAAVASILIKEGLYHYTMYGAKKTHSEMLKADAWHHRSDALSSIGSFVGIAGARMGLPILDPIASVVICVMIMKVAFDIMHTSFTQMTDNSIDEQTAAKISKLVLEQEGVIAIDELRTRSFSSKFYIDIEIAVDGSMTLYDAHEIAERVHDAVEAAFPLAKHCMVHVNPYQPAKEILAE